MVDLYKRDLQAEEMSLDKMPHKSVKKWKKKDRQRAKKECRKHTDGTVERERDAQDDYIASRRKDGR